MIAALILAIALFLASVGMHLSILGAGHRVLDAPGSFSAKLGVALLVLASHLLVATLFAGGFWLGAELDLGGFDKTPAMRARRSRRSSSCAGAARPIPATSGRSTRTGSARPSTA